MDQTRSNQQSTKSASPTVDTNASEDFTPTLSPDDTTRSNHVFATVHNITGKIATDQTRIFYYHPAMATTPYSLSTTMTPITFMLNQ